ncbi:DUF1648 domain-containing protein [Saccharomonospora sp. NPDC046836]|uniref:DUF1648 domain-containing protein n=1 Tax=Saccharomonospora sp. NPDC046836 TaxID=3156921 RepID=UPI0033CB40FB
MKVAATRALLTTLGVPALAAGAAWLLQRAWSSRLPEPIAIHWGPSGPDRTASLGGFTAATLGSSAALATAGAVLALVILRHGNGVLRGVLAFYAWLAAFPAALLIAVLTSNLDAPGWQQAGFNGGSVAALAASALAALLGAVVAGPSVPPARQTEELAPGDLSVGLGADQRATWVGSASSRVALVVFVLLLLALAVLPALTGAALPVAVYLIMLIPLAAVLVSTRLRVVVTGAGVQIRFGAFGIWRRRVPLADIAGATVERVTTWGHSGLGIRVNPITGDIYYKVRGGEALALRLHSGRTIAITVDRPEQAAGLVNDLLRQDSPQRS